MREQLLGRVVTALAKQRMPYMLIGGQAVLFDGLARLADDVDVTLGVDASAAEDLLAAPEDLIIHKLVARRPVDVEDVRTVLARHRAALNVAYRRRWLKAFEATGIVMTRPLRTCHQVLVESQGLGAPRRRLT